MSEPSYQPTGGSGPSGPRAGFWQRFGASFIDGIILGVIYVVFYVILGPNPAYGLYLVLSAAYFTYLEGGPNGQTFGKKALGIRVIDLSGGGPIGYGRGFIRWIGRIVSYIPLFLGYFWMLWDKEKQTWHDKFAGSVVVPESAYPIS
jgi:uncharacterized RDD family membrane protein YckC